MARCLHGRETGLDSLAHHQYVAGCGKPHRTATARAKHHFLRVDRRLAIARKVRWIASGASSTPRVTSATITGQMPPAGCFKPAWKRTVRGGESWRPRKTRYFSARVPPAGLADCHMATAALERRA